MSNDKLKEISGLIDLKSGQDLSEKDIISNLLFIPFNKTEFDDSNSDYRGNSEDCETHFGHRPIIELTPEIKSNLKNIHFIEDKHCELLKVLETIASQIENNEIYSSISELCSNQLLFKNAIDFFMQNPDSKNLTNLIDTILNRHFVLISYSLKMTKSNNLLNNVPLAKSTDFNCQIKALDQGLVDYKTALNQPTSWISQTVLNFDKLSKDEAFTEEMRNIFNSLLTEINFVSQIDSEAELDRIKSQPKEVRSKSLMAQVESITMNKNVEKERRLILWRFMVELTNSILGERKLRQILLFNDVLICLRKKLFKVSTNNFDTYLDIKWKIPLSEFTLYNKQIEFDQSVVRKREAKIQETKNSIRQLIQQKKQTPTTDRRYKKIIEDLAKLQLELILNSPKVEFTIGTHNTCYNLLIDSEKERNKWINTINELNLKLNHSQKAPSNHELMPALNKFKKLPSLNAYGIHLFSDYEEAISGILVTRIHTVSGNLDFDNYHLSIELDSYDQIETVARTKVMTPVDGKITWNQTFELDMDQSQMICFNLFKRDIQIAQLELVLAHDYLTNYENINHSTVTMDYESTRIIFNISLNLLQHSQVFKRKASIIKQNIFAKKFTALLEKDIIETEKKRQRIIANNALSGGEKSVLKDDDYPIPEIPIIITTLIEEIERRGLYEEGIYRIAGTMDIVQNMRREIDTNFKTGIKLISDCEIHAVANLVKQLFRESPDPLIDYETYQALAAVEKNIQDQERAGRYSSALKNLSSCNKKILIYLIDHFKRVDECSGQNKMNINNIAKVWALNLMQRSNDDHFQVNATHDSIKQPISKIMPNMEMLKEVEEVARMNQIMTEILMYSKKGWLDLS